MIKPIIAAVSEYLHVSVEDIYGRNRTKIVALARGLAVYYVRDRLHLSYPEIGAAFGRDHTTMMHHCRHLDSLMELKDYEVKCIRDLNVILKDGEVVQHKHLDSSALKVELEPKALLRLLAYHQTGLFGGTVEETAKAILSQKLFEMGEPT